MRPLPKSPSRKRFRRLGRIPLKGSFKGAFKGAFNLQGVLLGSIVGFLKGGLGFVDFGAGFLLKVC